MISKPLVYLYGIKRRSLRRTILWLLENNGEGFAYSLTVREIFSRYHGVDIGLYTMGGCFQIGQFDKFTTIGRYCSIAMTAAAFNRNHPTSFKSTHAFFFNPALECCKQDELAYTPLVIGNDVWLGHNSVIMPRVKYIGDGAIIAAGAIVHKDVPPYAVIAGNPSRVIRYRFQKETIDKLLKEKWWEKPIQEIKCEEEYFRNYS